MTVYQALDHAIGELTKAGVPDPLASANALLMYVLGFTREQLLMARQDQISDAQAQNFKLLWLERANRVPVAYLTGQKEFYGRTYQVEKNVLIPRPETEALVDWIVNIYQRQTNIQICDVGTGSGALAITLAKELPHAVVTAVDVCEKALNVARKNATRLEVRVQWQVSNLLMDVRKSFDVVVANLPYVNPDDISTLEPEVLHEPRRALFADEQGFELLYQLIEQAYSKVRAEGWLVLEHGQGQQTNLMKKMRETGWMHVKGYNDLAGIDRMVVGQKIE